MPSMPFVASPPDGYLADIHTIPVVDDKTPASGSESSTSGPKEESKIVAAWQQGDLRGMTIDSTPTYGDAVKRVRRVLVMVADKAVVVLDDIIPAAGRPGRVVSRFQAAHRTQWDAKAQTATITGRASRLRLQLDAPGMTAAVRGPNDFKNSWIFVQYAKAGWFEWHTIEAKYTADAGQPLLAVCAASELDRQAPPLAQVRRDGEQIKVILGDSSVEFQLTAAGWNASRP
jgi:hypothetical protein